MRVNAVLNRTVVVDTDWRFDSLCGSHLQSQSVLYHVSWWYYTLVIDLIGQLRGDVIGRLSVKPWCYWLWRLVINNWCVSIRLRWRWLPHRLSKRQSLSTTTVLFRITFTRSIKLNLLLKWLLGSNLSQKKESHFFFLCGDTGYHHQINNQSIKRWFRREFCTDAKVRCDDDVKSEASHIGY